MGLSRSSNHKRRLTGGKKRIWRKKRKHELGRQSANTRIGSKQISLVRVRGGNIKKRALRLEHGNFSIVSSCITKKTRIISVVYNTTNNELVRTNTLVKGSIIVIDASPFKNWLLKNQENSKKKKTEDLNETLTNIEEKKSIVVRPSKNFDGPILEQLNSGKLLARICSRPGQIGRSDGYILEKAELEFYLKKIQKKKL